MVSIKKLSERQKNILKYIEAYVDERGYPPSIREIGKRFRIKSTKTVSDVLQSLADKGYIQRDPARSRGVRLLGYSTVGRMQPVPFYGKIAAGEPLLIPENRERFITLDRAFVPSEDCFFLRVVGDSMIGRGIFDRDFVLVDPSARASDGDIIAARVGEEATVKTLQHRGATIVLEPANPDEREIIISPTDDFAVIGTIAAVFRPFHDRRDESDNGDAPPDAAD